VQLPATDIVVVDVHPAELRPALVIVESLVKTEGLLDELDLLRRSDAGDHPAGAPDQGQLTGNVADRASPAGDHEGVPRLDPDQLAADVGHYRGAQMMGDRG